MAIPKCSVDGCPNTATVEVRLYDIYLQDSETFIFDEQDFTCPHLCAEHVENNELNAKGERKPRGSVYYPYTNLHHAHGFTIYRQLDIPSPTVAPSFDSPTPH
jgi:hypothetical protein